MRILIAEDDFASRKFLSKSLEKYGDVDITVDGQEAVDAFTYALEERNYYDLVCLDMMMPKMDGIDALKLIRSLEEEKKVAPDRRTHIIMTTAINDTNTVNAAFAYGCEGYAAKPIDMQTFIKVMEKMHLI